MKADRPGPHPGWLLLAPAALYLVVFFLIPLAVILAYSFMTRLETGVPGPPLTLANYPRALDAASVLVLTRSVLLALATTAACLVLAYPVALWLHAAHGTAKALGTALVVVPSWMNILVKNYAWVVILRREGLLNSALAWMGLVDSPLALLFNQTAVVVGLIHTQLPFMVLPILAALHRLDRSLIDAARDLGASRWSVFRHVILPATRRGMLAGSVFVFVSSLGAFATPEILGGKDVTMVAALIQIHIYTARDWPLGAALAMVLMVFVLAALLLMMRPQHEGKALAA